MSLASRGGLGSLAIRCARSGRFPGGTQRGLRLVGGLVGVSTIAAAGRTGVEEVYGVPYLDVGCDVCFHVAGSPLLPTDHRDSPQTLTTTVSPVNTFTTRCRAPLARAGGPSPTC